MQRAMSHRLRLDSQSPVNCPAYLLHYCGSSGQPVLVKTLVLFGGQRDQNPLRKFLDALVCHARFLRGIYGYAVQFRDAVYTAVTGTSVVPLRVPCPVCDAGSTDAGG